MFEFIIRLGCRLRRHRHHHHHHHHRPTPVLIINNFAVELIAQEKVIMATSLHLDNLGNLAIVFADSKLNPISPAPTPDAPPSWSVSDATVASLAVAADGLTAVLTPLVSGGTTTVALSLVLGGTTFSASLDVSITAGAVASVAITMTPVPAP